MHIHPATASGRQTCKVQCLVHAHIDIVADNSHSQPETLSPSPTLIRSATCGYLPSSTQAKCLTELLRDQDTCLTHEEISDGKSLFREASFKLRFKGKTRKQNISGRGFQISGSWKVKTQCLWWSDEHCRCLRRLELEGGGFSWSIEGKDYTVFPYSNAIHIH